MAGEYVKKTGRVIQITFHDRGPDGWVSVTIQDDQGLLWTEPMSVAEAQERGCLLLAVVEITAWDPEVALWSADG